MTPFLFRRCKEMRKNPTPAERRAWRLLRDRRILGLKFRRQVTLCGYIPDFYCAELRLIIEVDGAIHDHRIAYDAHRTRVLEAAGYAVLRIRNEHVSASALEHLILSFIASKRTE